MSGTLPLSGDLSIDQILVALGRNAGEQLSLNDPDLLQLAGKTAGQPITFPDDFYGKSLFGTHDLVISYQNAVGTPTYGAGGVFVFDPLSTNELNPNTFTGTPSGSFTVSLLRLYKFTTHFDLKLRASDNADAYTVNRMIYIQVQQGGFWWPLSSHHNPDSLEFTSVLGGTSNADYDYLSARDGNTELVHITDETPDEIQSFVMTGADGGGYNTGFSQGSYGSLNQTSVTIAGTTYTIVQASYNGSTNKSTLKLKRQSSGDPFPSKTSFSYFNGEGVTIATSLASFSTNASDMSTGTCTWEWDKADASIWDVPRWSTLHPRDFCFID